MLRHDFYRFETARGLGAGQVCGMLMEDLYPPNEEVYRVKRQHGAGIDVIFYFTKAGVKRYGIKCKDYMIRMGYSVVVKVADQVPPEKIAYADKHQIAVIVKKDQK